MLNIIQPNKNENRCVTIVTAIPLSDALTLYYKTDIIWKF